MNETKRYLYVLYDELGHIKFGITSNLVKYIDKISNNAKIVDIYSTICGNSHSLDKKLLEYFGNYSLNGTEWIISGLQFFDVVNMVQKIVDEENNKEADNL